MTLKVLKFQATPNPNATKCVLSGVIRPREQGPASYRDRSSAEGDPLASRLLEIDGVVAVLINEDWITVNKRPQSTWKPIHEAIARLVERADPA